MKIGDAKLERLLYMIQFLIKEFGSPLTQTSLNYVWLYRLLNNLGVLKSIKYCEEMLKFTSGVLTDHKEKHIDGK